MEQIINQIKALSADINKSLAKLDHEKLSRQLNELNGQMNQPDFWQDNKKAQKVSQDAAKLQAKLQPWLQLKTEVSDLLELASERDSSLKTELENSTAELQKRFLGLKKELMFSGKYDDHDAILRLSAGVGGTDAQDWTEMLLRMYLRWAEKSDVKARLIDKTSGEEAGIKSATVELSGVNVYGKLKSEHGVHRLVRLSPFNSDNLRQTSFALVEVLPQIEQDELVIDAKDLKVDVFRAGGHGGQSVNTTDSAVRITHLPTGIAVAIQNERSQLQNKETAMKILTSKLVQIAGQQHNDKLSELRADKSADWGSQIRNYVLHPYSLVKDTRTGYETSDTKDVLDGNINDFIEAYLNSDNK